jgi:hypothetical protein
VDIGGPEVALELLPPPQADKVVSVLGEELEICVEVEDLWRVGAVLTEAESVVEVVVHVGARQEHRAIRVVGGGEVPRVAAAHDQGTVDHDDRLSAVRSVPSFPDGGC